MDIDPRVKDALDKGKAVVRPGIDHYSSWHAFSKH